MAITPLPPAPEPSDTQAQFDTKAFALVAALDQFVTETNATALAVDADAATATAQAGIATTKAGEASGSADEALAQASGTVATGSAKDWATKTSAEVVAGQGFGAKKYAEDAALSEAAAAGLVESYQGALAADPTLDKDGNPLAAGDWYINTATGFVRAYNGSAWVQGISVVAGVSSINGLVGDLTGFVTETGAQSLTNKELVDPEIKLGGTNGTAGQVPVSQGAGQPPTWGTVSSFGDATVTNPMSADITLTSASTRVQVVTPNAFGRKITLPNATTMNRGGQVFIFCNTEPEIPVSVVDASGANVGWVVSGSPTEVHLLANGTSAGTWLLHNGDPASAGGVFLYGQEKSAVSGAVLRRSISLALNTDWYFANQTGGASVIDYGIWDGRQFGRAVQFGSATGSPSTQSTNDLYHMCSVSSTLAFVCWQDTSIYQFRCRVFSVDANGSLTEGAIVNIGSTNNAVQPHCAAIDSSRVLVVWQNNSNQLSGVVVSISGTTCTVGAPITVSTAGGSGGWCAVLTTTLAHIVSNAVHAVSISGTTLSVLGTSNFSGLSPLHGIFRASDTQSIVIAADSATPPKIVAVPVTNTGSAPTIGTASAGLMAGASAQVGVSQLGSTGRALVISGVGVGNTVAESSFAVVGMVSGVATVMNRGVLPPNFGQNKTYVSVASGHGMLPLARASASPSAGSVPQIFKKFVITGGV